MKMLRVLAAVLSFASIPSAQAAQVLRVDISEASPSQAVMMTDQRFEPIYESQPYLATCNRQVVDHMNTICETVVDNVCHGGGGEICQTESSQVCNSSGCTTIPRRVCHTASQICENIPRRVCSDHAVYRTEYYSCIQYHNVVVGQRLVKSFQNSVEVLIDHPEALQGQKLSISLVAREASVDASLVSSFGLNMLTQVKRVVFNSDNGVNQVLATRILIHVDAATELTRRILMSSIQNLALHRDSITMKIAGAASLAQSLMIDVNLTSHRAIIRNKSLVNQTIDSSTLSLVAQGNDLLVTLSLAKLGADSLKNKRHNLTVSAVLKRPGNILNATDLGAILNKKLEASLTDVTPN